MVVVPAFAHCEYRQKPIVSGIIASHIRLFSAHMCKRIDAEGRVINENRAPKEPDDQPRPSAYYKAKQSKRDRGNELTSVQPHQFGITSEVGDLHEVGCVMPAGEDPSQVAIEKALVARRVHIQLCVGIQVVMSVLSGPP